MKTKLEIIEETVKYYTENPCRRGTSNITGSCKYLTSDGKKCAVGRVIDESKFGERVTWVGLNDSGSVDGLESKLRVAYGIRLDDILFEEYKGHDTEFWADLQQFHDYFSYWIDGKFTEAGQKFVNQLKEKYKHS